MSTISVVTAVDPRRADHLAAAWDSLACQVMPPGWSWEWLVQCDSTDPDGQQAVRRHLPGHPQVSFAASRRGGPAIARTMTLARARGPLIKTLDADDRLTSGALARDIAAHANPGVLWSASRVVDEYPDGRRENHYPWDPPPGPIRPGTAWAAYKRDWRILVHPATLCIRHLILLALGGWMALPASEDTALLMALDACGGGFFIPETGMIYRRWPPQMSASAEHVESYELDARRTLVLHRAEAVSDWVAARLDDVAGADFPRLHPHPLPRPLIPARILLKLGHTPARLSAFLTALRLVRLATLERDSSSTRSNSEGQQQYPATVGMAVPLKQSVMASPLAADWLVCEKSAGRVPPVVRMLCRNIRPAAPIAGP